MWFVYPTPFKSYTNKKVDVGFPRIYILKVNRFTGATCALEYRVGINIPEKEKYEKEYEKGDRYAWITELGVYIPGKNKYGDCW